MAISVTEWERLGFDTMFQDALDALVIATPSAYELLPLAIAYFHYFRPEYQAFEPRIHVQFGILN